MMLVVPLLPHDCEKMPLSQTSGVPQRGISSIRSAQKGTTKKVPADKKLLCKLGNYDSWFGQMMTTFGNCGKLTAWQNSLL